MAIYVGEQELSNANNQSSENVVSDDIVIEEVISPSSVYIEIPDVKPAPSPLSALSYVKEFNVQDDGKTFINIGSKAKTELGVLLSWTTPIQGLYSIYGKVGTIRNFSDALTIKNFPSNYMGMAKIPKDILEKHVFNNKSKKLSIPNYWSLIAYITAEGIRARKKLIDLMKANTLDYGCVTELRKATVFGSDIVIPSTIRQMINYVGIVRGLDRIVKEDKIFDNHVVGAFIDQCKLKPELEITAGVQLTNITIKE